MLHGYPKAVWYAAAGALVLLFVVNYIEFADWKRASIPVVSIVALISLLVAFTSLMLAPKRFVLRTYVAGAAGAVCLILLWLLYVPLTRILAFAGFSFFAAVVFVIADWVKGRTAR